MYSSGLYEVMMRAEAGEAKLDISSTGNKAFWIPGMMKHVIRAVAVGIENTIGATGTINFNKRITIGSDTGIVEDVVAAVNLLTTHTQGKVVYRENLNVTISPGEELIVAVDDAAAGSDLAYVILLVEPVYERPGNVTAMVAST